MMRPDGSSAVSVLSGDSLSAELAHELMGIQGIPDPSLLSSSSVGVGAYSQGSSAASDKEERDSLQDDSTEFLADPVFIHTKRNGAVQYCPSRLRNDDRSDILSGASSRSRKDENGREGLSMSDNSQGRYLEIPTNGSSSGGVNFFVLPLRVSDDSGRVQHESFDSMLRQLRDQVLSMPRRSFAKPISERDWLRNAARIWDMVKRSPVIADYSKTLQSSGLYRR